MPENDYSHLTNKRFQIELQNEILFQKLVIIYEFYFFVRKCSLKPSLSQRIQMHEIHAPNARFHEMKTAMCKLRRVRNYLPSTLSRKISIDISPSL